MKAWTQRSLLLVGVMAALLVCGWLIFSLFSSSPQASLQEAYDSYVAGEKASTVEERQRFYNRSLQLYAALEEEYRPTRGNGKLYYNMANVFYQLEAYPWAIYNGYKALSLRPRDRSVQENLARAQKKIGLAPVQHSTFHTLFFFHTLLSLPERIQLVSACAGLAFIAFSLYIWTRAAAWRIAGICLSGVLAVFLLSAAYSYYLAPVEAVIIRSSLLVRDAGTQYAPVSEAPEPSGQKVEVLAFSEEGKWAKILTPTGMVGFIPSEKLRLIE